MANRQFRNQKATRPTGQVRSLDEHKLDDATLTPEEREVAAWRELGFEDPPKYRDESTAPPVDRELLLRVVRHQASTQEQAKVHELTRNYRSWAKAEAGIGIKETGRKLRDEPEL